MSNQLLKGKKGIISGALNDKSIAWKVAEKAYEQGAEIVLTNAPIAMRMRMAILPCATGSSIACVRARRRPHAWGWKCMPGMA
jgi:enoyl-[acyl-carrier protein] reductase I